DNVPRYALDRTLWFSSSRRHGELKVRPRAHDVFRLGAGCLRSALWVIAQPRFGAFRAWFFFRRAGRRHKYGHHQRQTPAAAAVNSAFEKPEHGQKISGKQPIHCEAGVSAPLVSATKSWPAFGLVI